MNLNFERPAEFRVISGNVFNFQLAEPNAKLPVCADEGSSGYDLFSVEEVTLEPGEFKLVSTGLKWEPPNNTFELQVRPRSGLAAKHGITVLNSPGTVDASYRGIIKVILINHSKLPYTIKVGDRIAQAVIATVLKNIMIIQAENLSDTIRGDGGMGSTGR